MSRPRTTLNYHERVWQRLAGARRLAAIETASGVTLQPEPAADSDQACHLSSDLPQYFNTSLQDGRAQPIRLWIWEDSPAIPEESLQILQSKAEIGILAQHVDAVTYATVIGALQACRHQSISHLSWLRWGAQQQRFSAGQDFKRATESSTSPWKLLPARIREQARTQLDKLFTLGWQPRYFGADGVIAQISMEINAVSAPPRLTEIWQSTAGMQAVLSQSTTQQWRLDLILDGAESTQTEGDQTQARSLIFLPMATWDVSAGTSNLQQTG